MTLRLIPLLAPLLRASLARTFRDEAAGPSYAKWEKEISAFKAFAAKVRAQMKEAPIAYVAQLGRPAPTGDFQFRQSTHETRPATSCGPESSASTCPSRT
jgi:hypothetical protein